MPSRKLSTMEMNYDNEIENKRYADNFMDDFWPLAPVDPTNAKFPCCLVWTPLPVVSWLAPFIGHVGICMENGTILDFSGSNFVNVDDFAFGPVARVVSLRISGPTNASTVLRTPSTVQQSPGTKPCSRLGATLSTGLTTSSRATATRLLPTV
ncbi:Protein REVERSION-TO-ETHYLENE SENSITIVITY1 [Striga hermonthica]|uniref:Protein REVERSION-TO-ETHYLENE SENSITIVITY1 n=1 Tax=Striga hermonthica TaxID=68872 RepID=A0A9N7RNL3_STRHE|nr:Protein REVERSION-TO-ETHYLENE SENSITIVITY1 [Striga hermonthica]